MSTGTDEIFDRALSLPAESRATLAEKLIDSLADAGTVTVDEAWIDEAKRRLRDYDQGSNSAIPAEEVFRSLKS